MILFGSILNCSLKFNVIVMQNKQLHICLFKKVFLFILLAKSKYITHFYERYNAMKRLLLSSLFGCIMMGQLHAGEIVIPEKVTKFIGAALITAGPALAIRAGIVAKNNEMAKGRQFSGRAFCHYMQFNRIVLSESCLFNGEGCNKMNNSGQQDGEGLAFHKQESTNRWTAAFLAAMLAAGVARLSANYLPANVRDFIVRSFSMPTAAGVAFGAGIPLWFMLPHLRHDRTKTENGTDGDCDPRALRRKYYPHAQHQTLSGWEKTRRILFAL